MKRRAALATLAALGSLGAADAARALALRDDLGRALQLPALPRRLISLGPSITEAVAALGGLDRLVGVDRFSDHPEPVRHLPQLGGLGEVSLEQIVALRPDLVLLNPASRLHDRLGQLGVPAMVLDAQTLPEVRRLLGQVAAVLGRAEAADALWRQQGARIRAAAQALPAAWRGVRCYVEVDPSPYAAGEASFIGALLAELGLANIVPAALGAFPKLNPEFVLRAAPALIFIGTESAATLAQRPGWAALPALRARRVAVLSREAMGVIGRPGPRLGEAAERLAAALHGLTPP